MLQDAEKQARTVEVEVSLPRIGASGNLLPGYSADIEVLVESRDDVLRVPSEAVLEGARMLVYERDSGTLNERKISPGLSNWAFTEVRSGLRRGSGWSYRSAAPGSKPGASAVVGKRVNPPREKPGHR